MKNIPMNLIMLSFGLFAASAQAEASMAELQLNESLSFPIAADQIGKKTLSSSVFREVLYFSEGEKISQERVSFYDAAEFSYCAITASPDLVAEIPQDRSDADRRVKEKLNAPVDIARLRVPFTNRELVIHRNPNLRERMSRIGELPVKDFVDEPSIQEALIVESDYPEVTLTKESTLSVFHAKNHFLSGAQIGEAKSKNVGNRKFVIICNGPTAKDKLLTSENLERAFGRILSIQFNKIN